MQVRHYSDKKIPLSLVMSNLQPGDGHLLCLPVHADYLDCTTRGHGCQDGQGPDEGKGVS